MATTISTTVKTDQSMPAAGVPVKTVTSLANVGKQNTPPIWHTVGQVCMFIGGLGGIVALLPISAPVATTVGMWIAVAGFLGKAFSQTKGVVPVTDGSAPQ